MQKLLNFLVVVCVAAFITLCALGCSGKPHSPRATSTAGGVSVNQTGDAAVPARAWSVTNSAVVPLPAGSSVTFNEKLGTFTATLSSESVLRAETRSDHAEAPQAFTPPAPPTPTEKANGVAALWLRIGLAAGLAVGVFGLVKGWDLMMYGGGAVAAGCFLAMSISAIPTWLWVVIVAGATAAVLGPIIWHWKLKHFPAVTPLPAAPLSPAV